MTRNGAVAGLIDGAVTVVWNQISGGIFDPDVIVPGFILCGFAGVVMSRMSPPRDEVVACSDCALAASASPDDPVISA